MEKGPEPFIFSVGEILNCSLGGLPFIIPGHKLVSSSVCVQKCSCGFTFTMLIVSSCESPNFVRLQWGYLGLQGLKKFQDPLPFLSKVPLDLLVMIGVFTSRHIAQAEPRQGQKLVGGLSATSEA